MDPAYLSETLNGFAPYGLTFDLDFYWSSSLLAVFLVPHLSSTGSTVTVISCPSIPTSALKSFAFRFFCVAYSVFHKFEMFYEPNEPFLFEDPFPLILIHLEVMSGSSQVLIHWDYSHLPFDISCALPLVLPFYVRGRELSLLNVQIF